MLWIYFVLLIQLVCVIGKKSHSKDRKKKRSHKNRDKHRSDRKDRKRHETSSSSSSSLSFHISSSVSLDELPLTSLTRLCFEIPKNVRQSQKQDAKEEKMKSLKSIQSASDQNTPFESGQIKGEKITHAIPRSKTHSRDTDEAYITTRSVTNLSEVPTPVVSVQSSPPKVEIEATVQPVPQAPVMQIPEVIAVNRNSTHIEPSTSNGKTFIAEQPQYSSDEIAYQSDIPARNFLGKKASRTRYENHKDHRNETGEISTGKNFLFEFKILAVSAAIVFAARMVYNA